MRIPDVTLLQQISHVADLVNMYADDASRNVMTAVEYSVLIDAPAPTDDPTAYFESQIRRADNAYCDAKEFITQMDKQIAELLRLRGKLAEEIDIPMFSNIGENKRYPKRDIYNL